MTIWGGGSRIHAVGYCLSLTISLTFGWLWLGFCAETSQHLAFSVNALLRLKRPLVALSGKLPVLKTAAALT